MQSCTWAAPTNNDITATDSTELQSYLTDYNSYMDRKDLTRQTKICASGKHEDGINAKSYRSAGEEDVGPKSPTPPWM